MSLYKNPTDAIFESIEALNNITLTRQDYDLGLPQVIDPPVGALNTSITLTSNNAQATYEGEVTVRYTRLDLASLAILLPLPVRATGITTTTAAANALNTYFGLNLTASDYEEAAVSLVNDAGTVTLTAKDTSLGWFGQVELTFVKGNIDINSVTPVKTLPGLLYPAQDDTKPFGQLYSYWRNFSAWYSTLQGIDSTDDLVLLAPVLASATSDAWSIDQPARYSLLGATFASNGLTTRDPLFNSLDYTYALVVNLGEGSLGLSGQLIIQYNEAP